MLFTHFGLSGPAILRCSQFVVKELKKQPQVPIRIDLYPDINEETLFQKMYKELKEAPKKPLKRAEALDAGALSPIPARKTASLRTYRFLSCRRILSDNL